MEARLPYYLVAALGGLLAFAIGVLLVIRMPARATLAGLPAPVTVRVGALPDDYAAAVSTRLLDLLLTWNQENRIARFRDASRLMSGPASSRYKKWANSSVSILETLQVEQRAKLRPVSVTRLSQDLFVTETAVEIRRYTGGLGGGTERFTYNLLLRRLPDAGSRPAVLSVVGLRATAVSPSPSVESDLSAVQPAAPEMTSP